MVLGRQTSLCSTADVRFGHTKPASGIKGRVGLLACYLVTVTSYSACGEVGFSFGDTHTNTHTHRHILTHTHKHTLFYAHTNKHTHTHTHTHLYETHKGVKSKTSFAALTHERPWAPNQSEKETDGPTDWEFLLCVHLASGYPLRAVPFAPPHPRLVGYQSGHTGMTSRGFTAALAFSCPQKRQHAY